MSVCEATVNPFDYIVDGSDNESGSDDTDSGNE